ncbi:MAG: beta-galactosidase [Armatimonadota bacterium]|nr:beta-galactosidase [Armatimonadota bacterium]
MCKLLVMILLSAWSMSTMAQNLIRNPSFEEGQDAPAHWLFWTRTTGQGTWDGEVAHSGRRSVRIIGAEANDNWSQRHIPIEPGYLYRFRVWLKQKGCYPWPPDVVVTACDKDGRALQTWQFRGRQGTRDWYLLEDLFVPPANAASANIELRMLHLMGTVWFDDVALEKVGKWMQKPPTRDPEADAAKKRDYLRRLSKEVVTPHRRWAARLWNPAKVFFAVDRLAQREIVELDQRFRFPWHTVFITSEWICKFMTGEYYDQLTLEELRAAYRSAIEEPLDAIVLSGSVWDGLEEQERARTLQKVEQGATLVYFGKPLTLKPEDPLPRALGIRWTDREVTARPVGDTSLLCAYPEALPPFSLHVVEAEGGQVVAEAQDVQGNRYPLIVEHRHGAGRTLLVAYRSEASTAEVRGAGVTPVLSRSVVANLTYDYHEYLLASVMRWILYAVQPNRWRVEGARAEQMDSGVRAVLRFPAPGKVLQARCSWRDAFSREVATARYTIQPSDTQLVVPFAPKKPPIAGNLFLEVAFVDGDALLDCCALSTTWGKVRLEVQLDKPVAPRGGRVTGVARITGLPVHPGRTYRLQQRLRDCYGWEWERIEQPIATETGAAEVRFSVPLARMRSTGGTLTLTIEDAGRNALAEQRVEVIQAADHRWDDWQQVMWTVFGRSGYRPYLWEKMAQRLREMGISTWLFNVHGEEWRTAARYDFRLVPIGIYGVYSSAEGFSAYATTGDKRHLHRKPICPNQPEQREQAATAISRIIAQLGEYQPLSYCLSDENNLTYFNAPFDWCFCPHCLRGFREWLRTRYGSLQAMNRAWKREYTTWEQVEPDTFEEAKARGVWTSWADHREYMDSVFVDVWKRIRHTARQQDPNVSLSISGTPEPFAYGGYDWYPLAQQFDALFSYTDYFADHTARAPWSAGYGSSGANLSFNIWSAAFRGCKGISAFWLPSLLEPDLTLPTSASDLQRFSRPLREGLGKLLLHAPRVQPQVAIYLSMPSLRAAFALGLEKEADAQREAFMRLLRSFGVAFTLVDARQVEQGWLLKYRPKLLLMPVTLAMSDREVKAVQSYLAQGGKVLADVMPAVFNQRLEPRPNSPFAGITRSPNGKTGMPNAPELWELPDLPLPREGRMVCLQRTPLATYLRETTWRACPEVDARCRQREQWLRRVLRWAGVTPPLKAVRRDGQPVQDCLWAERSLGKGARLVGLVREATAVDTERVRLQVDKGVVVDVLTGQRLSSKQVVFDLKAGEVKILAVLPQAPGAPQVRLTHGQWRAGQRVQVAIRVPNAPEWSAARAEVRDAQDKPLAGLSQNLLLRDGQATFALDLPRNLPRGSRLVVRHVLTGEQQVLR